MAQSSRCVVWHGTQLEEEELAAAVERSCTCGPLDEAAGLCSAHQMLVGDQPTLDRLVFARRIADRLQREEGLSAAVPASIDAERRGQGAA